MRSILLLPLVGMLSACATVSSPVPEGYSGPVVELSDTGVRESGGKGTFFAALSIDGRDIDNALRQSRMASHGQGFALTMKFTQRQVPVVPMKVSVIGTHKTAAPIHELAARAAGTFFSVEGIVDFKPTEGRSYVVTGELKKAASCVWIADAETRVPATEKVCKQ